MLDTTRFPLCRRFDRTYNQNLTSFGAGFDITTNVMIATDVSEASITHFDDPSPFAFNFATLDTSITPATAEHVQVPGLGETARVGLAGAEAQVNSATHQAVIADVGGENFKLVQLPKAPVAGKLDNNGQPGTATTADAASAFMIAASVLPTVKNPAGKLQHLFICCPSGLPLGNLTTLTIDPLHNFFYLEAGGIGAGFLARVDLSKPVFGAGPLGGPTGKTFWNPKIDLIPFPEPVPTSSVPASR